VKFRADSGWKLMRWCHLEFTVYPGTYRYPKYPVVVLKLAQLFRLSPKTTTRYRPRFMPPPLPLTAAHSLGGHSLSGRFICCTISYRVRTLLLQGGQVQQHSGFYLDSIVQTRLTCRVEGFSVEDEFQCDMRLLRCRIRARSKTS
jgi:hypothetical protein